MKKTPFTSAAQAVEWIDGLRYTSAKNGLENMRALLSALNNPQKGMRCVHVAGTNGKGSTCAMLERMLRSCGLKTGLYTSPYLMRYTERMRISGIPVDDAEFIRHAERVRSCAEGLADRGIYPTWFELGTAIALDWFASEKVDIAVIEVGLGGRLDATNLVEPDACLIGPIDLEHTAQLGTTLEAIAGEKAGIIKDSVPVSIQRQRTQSVRDVFISAADAHGAPLTDLAVMPPERIVLSPYGAEFDWNGHHARIVLPGRHQVDNACLALSGIDILRRNGWNLPEDEVLFGLSQAVWPGRLEWLAGGILLDGAHNAHGFTALREYVREFLAGRRVVCVLGIMKDKNVESCFDAAASFADAVIATRVDYARALDAETIADSLRRRKIVSEAVIPVGRAIDRARELAGRDGVVLICGSLYLAGDARLILKDDGGKL